MMLLYLGLLSILLAKSHGFVVTAATTTTNNNRGSSSSHRFSSVIDIDAASTLLLWEALEESNSRPVLDLSAREGSPEMDNASLTKQHQQQRDSSEWSKGQRWKSTEQALTALGVDTDSFLTKCPQLLRLETEMVLETAEWVIEEFSVAFLESEPRLLGFPLKHVSYGLEFMSLMMMMPAKAACAASSALLLAGIEGGLQEQAVSAALGTADQATRQANQKIAGDTIASLNELKNKRKGL